MILKFLYLMRLINDNVTTILKSYFYLGKILWHIFLDLLDGMKTLNTRLITISFLAEILLSD